MSTLKKDHVLGAGSAALAGGAAGAAIGTVVAGPAGLALGAAAGGALGAIVGNRAAEAADRRNDLGHFEQIFRTMPYYVAGYDWHDYAPAYRYGLESCQRSHDGSLDELESQLHGGWEAASHFGSRLDWVHARPAIEHAWQSLRAAPRKPAPSAAF